MEILEDEDAPGADYAACVSQIMREGLGTIDLFDEASIADTAFAFEKILSFAEEHRGELEALGLTEEGDSDPARRAATSIPLAEFARTLHLLNQYVDFDGRAASRVAACYSLFFRELLACLDEKEGRTERLAAQIVAHRKRLGEALADIPGLRDGDRAVAKPCFCYSPELQMSILRLEPGAIREPLLDIGCGPEALLVRALRDRGVKAFGIDRSISRREDYLVEAEWEGHDLGAEAWGTIVSNLAFSNHFIYHYIRDDGADIAYLRRYMDILAALEPGGSFRYAPALPFVERHLDRGRYCVETTQLIEGSAAAIVTRIRERFV
jgi:hypothetical protein